MKINHQIQPTWDSCVSACIAMISDRLVEEVTEEFHELYIDQKIEVDEYLHRKGIKCRPLVSVNAEFMLGRFYMLSVPSLNKDAHMHAILAYWDDDQQFRIEDPNKGKEGKRYYIEPDKEPLNDNELCMVGYSSDYEVWYSE